MSTVTRRGRVRSVWIAATGCLCFFQAALAAPNADPAGRTPALPGIERSTDEEAARPAPEPMSSIEAAFSERAGETLRQFGYDAARGTRGIASQPLGAVRGDYVLGVGDTLFVTSRGRVNSERRVEIGRDGTLLVDSLRPIPAQGRTLDEVRSDVAASAKATLLDVETFISLAEARRVGVLVLGAVGRPGRVELTSFADVFDALTAAGGVERVGSLRRIALSRGNETRTVDLYGTLLTGRGGGGERVRDGDRILVPPLGATIAVSGPVKRPGIFELPIDRDRLSVAEARALAGGLIRPAGDRALRLGLRSDGGEAAEEVRDLDAPVLGDGDVLILRPGSEDRRGAARLDGAVLRPGLRSLDAAPTLSALVRSRDLRPGAWRPLAALETDDPRAGGRKLIAVDLGAVLAGRADRRLGDGDSLIVLDKGDVDFLSSNAVLRVLRGESAGDTADCPGLGRLALALSAAPDGRLARGPGARAAARMVGVDARCPAVFKEHPDLALFALQRSTLVMNGGTATGFRPQADLSGEEGGAASVEDDETPRVELAGAVRHPGVRPLVEGAALKNLLRREIADGTYPLFGVIERYDRKTFSRSLVAFSPRDVISGRTIPRLASGDVVRPLTYDEIARAAKPAPERRKPAASSIDASAKTPAAEEDADDLDEEEPPSDEIVRLIGERSVRVTGAARRPGSHPVADTATVSAVIEAAGGVAGDGDPTEIEVTFRRGGERKVVDLTAGGALTVAGGDSIRVPVSRSRLEAGTILVEGRVKRPGAYDIVRGERLSSVLRRAGGLDDDAYPAGAALTRVSERRRLEEEMEESARRIERDILLVKERGDQVKPDELIFLRQVAARLRATKPTGRIVVEADPAALRSHPEHDTGVEPGDRLTIPARPLTVVVSGEVSSPGAKRFESGKSAEDYVSEAGGPTRFADMDRAFLVMPDGSARPLSLASWNHVSTLVPPGSAVVVPADPKPLGGLDIARDLGGILGQLALTAASISVISR